MSTHYFLFESNDSVPSTIPPEEYPPNKIKVMPPKKLLTAKGLKASELPSELNPDEKLCSYFFAFVWTRDGSAITLTSVVTSPFGKFEWTPWLSTVKTESDGEIDLPIGLQKTGAKLDLIFSLNPHQNINAAAILIVNHTTGITKQIAPQAGTKTLSKGTPWAEPLTITLP